MAQFSGVSSGGFDEIVKQQTATAGSWFFGTEYSDAKPQRVGYYYFTFGLNNSDAMSVISSGVLYKPGHALSIPQFAQLSNAHFSLWVRWDISGQYWTVFT